MKADQQNGFTLIEVLIAVAILGIGMAVLLTGASRCLAALKQARVYQQAQWTLQMGMLEHPMLPTDDVDDWIVDGETYDNDMTFYREVEEEESEADQNDGLFIVHSGVRWTDKGNSMREEVVEYVLNLKAVDGSVK